MRSKDASSRFDLGRGMASPGRASRVIRLRHAALRPLSKSRQARPVTPCIVIDLRFFRVVSARISKRFARTGEPCRQASLTRRCRAGASRARPPVTPCIVRHLRFLRVVSAGVSKRLALPGEHRCQASPRGAAAPEQAAPGRLSRLARSGASASPAWSSPHWFQRTARRGWQCHSFPGSGGTGGV